MCLQVNASTFNSSKKYAKNTRCTHAHTHQHQTPMTMMTEQQDEHTTLREITTNHETNRETKTKCAIYCSIFDRIYINIFMDFSLAICRYI